MHGYEIIEQLEERSGGAWRPSPGAIYPALRRLEARGLVVGDDDEQGKRIYSITGDGHERVAGRDPDAPAPWEAFAEEGPSLRSLGFELMSQLRQIGRFGTPEQRRGAADIVERATADLYQVMVERPGPATSAAADDADG
jgi:DNA-binding PadR family transcriptional regulator